MSVAWMLETEPNSQLLLTAGRVLRRGTLLEEENNSCQTPAPLPQASVSWQRHATHYSRICWRGRMVGV